MRPHPRDTVAENVPEFFGAKRSKGPREGNEGKWDVRCRNHLAL